MDEIPKALEDYVLKLPCGSKRRIKHCKPDSSMLVNHTIEGISCYCFRCGFHGFKPHGRQSIAELMRRTAEYKASLVNVKVLTLPHDYTLSVPPQYMTWYLRYGISAEEAKRNRVGYTDELKRIVIPVYEESKHKHVSGLVLTNIQMRTVIDGVKPKYLVPGYSSPEHANAIFWSSKAESDVLVITEDVLSAIKIGQWYSTCAILGTNMTDIRAAKIAERYSKVVTWFDNDKAGNTARVLSKKKLSMCGIDVKEVVTPDDPKCYTRTAAHEIIGAALNA